MYRGRGRGGGGRGGGGGGYGGGGGGGGGGVGPPPGLRGRELGLWYAKRSKKQTRDREMEQRPTVNMSQQREKEVKVLLRDMEKRQQHEQLQVGPSQGEPPASWEDSMDVDSTPHTPVQQTVHAPLPNTLAAEGHGVGVRSISEQDPVLDGMLLEEQQLQRNGRLQAARQRLPAYAMAQQIVDLVRSNQVCVISGETGCGKTTQVPQFILDGMVAAGKGSTCRIVCTQPRRISAIAVAERVADERGESLGSSVGYQIRLDSRMPRERGAILFCTTGILLRYLQSDGGLNGISHLVLDEIHERDILADFLIIILKTRVLPKRPDLKVVLMSATLNAAMFSAYFNSCPALDIPGFTFPVTEYWLEDVVRMTGYQGGDQQRHNSRPRGGFNRHRGRGGYHDASQIEKEAEGEAMERALLAKGCPDHVVDVIAAMDDDRIDLDLVEHLIFHICRTTQDGAILVFLSGWDEISKLHEKVSKNPRFSDPRTTLLLPLHSMMPTINQHEIFERPPPGVRKIILSTNIAETSITIDDVVHVIDCGKVKEKGYEAEGDISMLRPVWVSKASARQRRGRAGRVQDGFCYHLFTSFKADRLAEFNLPEMLRTPLEELCLQIKILGMGRVRQFLLEAIQPPEPAAITNALATLDQLGCLDAAENLTALGFHLATLPVHPRIGKIILFGAIFHCLDPVLTIAASLGFRDPFVIPLNKQADADRVRFALSKGTYSDHLTFLNAFMGWKKATQYHQERDYCWEHFLSQSTLRMIDQMKSQFYGLLKEIRFVGESEWSFNANSDNMALVRAILCAGLYPNVIKAQHRPQKRPRPDGSVELHPRSVLANGFPDTIKWLLYFQKVKTSQVFVYDATPVEPYALLFFGGQVAVLEDGGHPSLAVDDWIISESPPSIADLVKKLRHQLDELLKRKIDNPALSVLSDAHSRKLIETIIELITTDDNQPAQRDDDWGEDRRGHGGEETRGRRRSQPGRRTGGKKEGAKAGTATVDRW